MRVPEEFDQFCSRFVEWQVVMDCYGGSLETLIEEVVLDLNEHQRLVVRQFLDKLLSGRYSSADLVGIWRRTSAGMNLGNAKQTVARLRYMHDLLADPARMRALEAKLFRDRHRPSPTEG